jgi:hypothetical protein
MIIRIMWLCRFTGIQLVTGTILLSLLLSHPLPKTLKIGIQKSVLLSGVLYGCETWFLTSIVLKKNAQETEPKKNVLSERFRILHN